MQHYFGDVATFADSTGVDASQICCECMNHSSIEYVELCVSGPEVYSWVDKHQLSCDVYTSLNWCEEGGVGTGWDSAWGSLNDLADINGLNATDSCCGCMNASSLLFQSQCNMTNVASVWHDKNGLVPFKPFLSIDSY